MAIKIKIPGLLTVMQCRSINKYKRLFFKRQSSGLLRRKCTWRKLAAAVRLWGCEAGRFDGACSSDATLLDCDAVNARRRIPTFRRNMLPMFLCLNWNPEDGGRIFFQSFATANKSTRCHNHSLIHHPSLFDFGRICWVYWKVNAFRHVQLIADT
jgi:hypothetical protein